MPVSTDRKLNLILPSAEYKRRLVEKAKLAGGSVAKLIIWRLEPTMKEKEG